MVKICARCKTENAPAAGFCSKCGAALGPAQAGKWAPPATGGSMLKTDMSQWTAHQKSKFGWGMLILLLACVWSVWSSGASQREEARETAAAAEAAAKKKRSDRIAAVKATQEYNASEFERTAMFREIIYTVAPSERQRTGLWITCDKGWDRLSLKDQDMIKDVWFRTWVSICKKRPIGEPGKHSIAIFNAGGGLDDELVQE